MNQKFKKKKKKIENYLQEREGNKTKKKLME